ATLLTRQDFNEFFFTHFLHSLFSGKDRDLKIQRQRVLYRGLTIDLSDKTGALDSEDVGAVTVNNLNIT
ncbi:hypothetical protein ACMSEA_04875, partial [Bacteroides thetaiotaomicron]|uniref:hypothetical protein n=1 Tax=Bacteroides thetaiotaomicron TaxID=818 RepID=UPI0039C27911